MSRTRTIAATALRILVPIGILAWLVYQLIHDDPQSLQHFLHERKNWVALTVALAAYFAAVITTFARWYILVRALRIPFCFEDALRLGFIGYLFQFVSLGAVGGDVFKAVFLYREQESRKAEAVATILVDRIVGLLGLLILASIGCFFFIDLSALAQFRLVGIFAVSLASAGIFVLFGLLYTSWNLWSLAQHLPRESAARVMLMRVQTSLDLYRQNRSSVLGALGMSIVSHTLNATMLYFASRTLFEVGPSFSDQMVLWSIAGAIGALPISPAGLGTFDLAYKFLYERLTPAITVANPGTLVAFLFRALCLVVAAVGVAYYLGAQRSAGLKSEPDARLAHDSASPNS